MANLLSKSEVLAFLDSVAVGYQRVSAVKGTGTEENTQSKQAYTNLQRVFDTNNYDIIKMLMDGAYQTYQRSLSAYIYQDYQLFLMAINRAQNNNLDAFLTSEDARIPEEVANMYSSLGITISPANILPPAVENMGTYDYDTSTFTDGDAIDTTKYGKAFIKVKPTVTVGSGSDLVLTVTVKKIDGTTEEKTVTIPAETSAGTEFFVGDGVSDMYVDVVDCSHTSGNAGDKVQFFSIYERTLNE